jgi:HD-GYP domain-containing protein (c-di-GMP phosphodiesterase class II)
MENENYLPIQSLDIEAGQTMNFSLFVQLPLNQKLLLYRKPGSTIESQKLEKFASGSAPNFYIKKEDYNEFVKYVALRLRSFVGAEDSGENRKLMTAAAKSLLTSTFSQTDASIVKALMGNLNDITSVIIENVLESSSSGSKKLFQKLSVLAQKGSHFQKHPVNTASLAVLITFGIGYSRSKILSDIATASLLHDLGLSKLPVHLISMAHDVLQANVSDRANLYGHPEGTLKILEERGIHVSELTKTIILQHHEEFNGSGYPSGLRGYTINELSQILRVADDIDQIFTNLPNSGGNLRAEITKLVQRLGEQKVIEPLLLSRIREVLI